MPDLLQVWIWAPVVLFVVIALAVSVLAVRAGRRNARDWRRADRSARMMVRALRLPRRVM